MDEKNAAVSELLLSRHWHVPTSMQHWGGVSSTDLESSPACLGENELALITHLLSGRAHQQHSWTTSGGSWRNLGVGPLVCSTESQGQASSTRLSNNWAMLNSSLHHWGQQTLPAGTALATAQPTRSAEQQLPGDRASSCVSTWKVEIHLHSYFTGCKPTHQACLCFLPLLSTMSVQLGLCHTHSCVTSFQRNPFRMRQAWRNSIAVAFPARWLHERCRLSSACALLCHKSKVTACTGQTSICGGKVSL